MNVAGTMTGVPRRPFGCVTLFFFCVCSFLPAIGQPTSIRPMRPRNRRLGCRLGFGFPAAFSTTSLSQEFSTANHN